MKLGPTARGLVGLVCAVITLCAVLVLTSVVQITFATRAPHRPHGPAGKDSSLLILSHSSTSVSQPHVDEEVLTTSAKLSSHFVSSIQWKGRCWYEARNFCVIRGVLTAFDPSVPENTTRKATLRMCNEFSKSSDLIRLAYYVTAPPKVLPAPLLTNVSGWVLQFWCMDLFHMTLTLMPALQTRKLLPSHAADIFVRIAKGKRSKGGYCRVKFGNETSWEDAHNKHYGGDRQFPFAGNPYWKFYKAISEGPDRLRPLYKDATEHTACYSHGVIDKMYVKEVRRKQAQEYSNTQLEVFGLKAHDYTNPDIARTSQQRKLRLTVIDRRGRTRRLTNIPELAEIGRELGFEVQTVAFESLTIQQQLRIVSTETDVLMGMHGNGIMWLQFLPPRSVVIELIGVWYSPYAKLWGHTHLHSSMKNNMVFKRQGEFTPFAHNTTEVEHLLRQAREVLREKEPKEADVDGDPNPQLDHLYRDCSPHC